MSSAAPFVVGVASSTLLLLVISFNSDVAECSLSWLSSAAIFFSASLLASSACSSFVSATVSCSAFLDAAAASDLADSRSFSAAESLAWRSVAALEDFSRSAILAWRVDFSYK